MALGGRPKRPVNRIKIRVPSRYSRIRDEYTPEYEAEKTLTWVQKGYIIAELLI